MVQRDADGSHPVEAVGRLPAGLVRPTAIVAEALVRVLPWRAEDLTERVRRAHATRTTTTARA